MVFFIYLLPSANQMDKKKVCTDTVFNTVCPFCTSKL